MKITTDKSKQITILSRVNEPGLPIVFEFLQAGQPFDITGLAFKYTAYRSNALGPAVFECTIGDGLTVQDTNKITLQLTTAKIADVKPGVLFVRLLSQTENNTWLNGFHKFHNKTFDGVLTSSVELEINNNGTTLEVNVTTGGVGASQNLVQVLTEGNDGGALQIKNIADPTDDQDAATKKYVDDNSGGGAVDSVNGQTGVVVLDANDVGAYPDNNPSGFVDAAGAASAAPVQSVTGSLVGGTGADPVINTPSAADVGADPAGSAAAALASANGYTDTEVATRQKKFSTKVVDTTTYTVLAEDLGVQILLTHASGCAVTLPNSLAQDFICEFVRKGGEVTFAATTTLQSKGTKLETQFTAAVAVHEGSNVWGLYGELT
jgi:hypothetical protein